MKTLHVVSIPDYIVMCSYLFLSTFIGINVSFIVISSIHPILGAFFSASIPIVASLLLVFAIERMYRVSRNGKEYKIFPIALRYHTSGDRLSILSETQVMNAILSFMFTGIISFAFHSLGHSFASFIMFFIVLALFVNLEFFAQIRGKIEE